MEVKVVENRQLSEKDFLLSVSLPEKETKAIKPGQFAMVQVRRENQLDPLLRRPLGIFDVENDTVSFIYRVVGRGTELLTETKDEVDVILPLGNYIEESAEKYLFIAGGIGIGGIFLAAKRFHQKGKKVTVIYGGRKENDLSALPFLEQYQIPYIAMTEDGSKGKKGLVTDILEEFKDHRWIACGPTGMLKAVQEKAEKLKADCFLSLDTRMACGVGSCLGCVIKTKEGYKRVCVDGPIFKADFVEL
ncbi:dihydroorotate dehydrogenase electron transfer subunit [Desulfurobacterium sp.]